jgi:hypothetical protein
LEGAAAFSQLEEQMRRNHSEATRDVDKQHSDDREAQTLESELAAAYAANAEMNRVLAVEFSVVDREGF